MLIAAGHFFWSDTIDENVELIGFSILLETIRSSLDKALKSVNVELIKLYWLIGAFISKQLSKSQWGDKQFKNFQIPFW